MAPADTVDAVLKRVASGEQFFYGDGECVTLTRGLTRASHTTTWRAGKKVMGNSVEFGTAIATFDAEGRYPRGKDEEKNSAVYLSQDPVKGIAVLEQYPHDIDGLPGYVHVRDIRPNGSPGISNNAAHYSVVCTAK